MDIRVWSFSWKNDRGHPKDDTHPTYQIMRSQEWKLKLSTWLFIRTASCRFDFQLFARKTTKHVILTPAHIITIYKPLLKDIKSIFTTIGGQQVNHQPGSESPNVPQKSSQMIGGSGSASAGSFYRRHKRQGRPKQRSPGAWQTLEKGLGVVLELEIQDLSANSRFFQCR